MTGTTSAVSPPSVIDITRWGKDHWSMLAYVETLCVDSSKSAGIGQIDHRRVRCNESKHPLLNANSGVGSWKPSYSTRLHGFFDLAGREDPAVAVAANLMIDGHDDWDCLDDAAAAGLVDILSMVNGFVKLTPAGMDMSAHLRQHKVSGGQFANFILPVNAETAAAPASVQVVSPPRPR